MTLTPRPYQSVDLAATIEVLARSGSAIGIAATGLGKAVLIALLAKHYVENLNQRVLVLADMGVLVDQLAETLEQWTGIKPGIERAESEAFDGHFGIGDKIVVGTVQTQFAKRGHRLRCHKWEPGEFGLVVADECEAYLAEKYRAVLEHHVAGGGHLFGCTATPMRGDDQGMAQLFRAVAFRRDIAWGVAEGYLVPPRQGTVRVDLDFSKLRINAGDYTDKSVHALLRDMDERRGLEFAHGIVQLSEDKQGIVVAPHVDSARAICDYINTVSPGMARSVYGTMSEGDKRDTLYGFKHGHFQVLCSVNMLTKGFDHPGVHNVFMCRPTRSKRLYTQVLGRGTRLIDPAIGSLASRDDRRRAIAASAKPLMTMYNMVGINADVRDLNIVDVLGGDMTPTQRNAAAAAVAERPDDDPETVIEEVKEQVAAVEARAIAEARAKIKARAEVRVRFSDALGAVTDAEFRERQSRDTGTIKPTVMRTLKRFKIPAWIISKLTDEEAGALASDCIRRAKSGRLSLNQERALARHGIDARNWSREAASRKLDELA